MTRIDVWLWSVRVYKSRSLATAAVKGGHIRLNGDPVKPSHAVKPGDTVTVHTPGWDRVLQVINPITKRVGAKLAVEAYEDLSAPRTRLPLCSPRPPRPWGWTTHQEGSSRDRSAPRPGLSLLRTLRPAQHTTARGRIGATRQIHVRYFAEDSPRGLWRSLGKRVGFTPSRVRISYPPRQVRLSVYPGADIFI